MKKRGKQYNNISNEKRVQLINLCTDQSLTIKEAATLIGINYKTAWTIINSYHKSSKVQKLVKSGSQIQKLTTDILLQVDEIISTEPQSTLRQIKCKLQHSNNICMSLTTLHNSLQKLMITVKKPHRELQKVNVQIYIEKRKLYSTTVYDLRKIFKMDLKLQFSLMNRRLHCI